MHARTHLHTHTHMVSHRVEVCRHTGTHSLPYTVAHLEHLSRSFTVTGTQDGCVHVLEACPLEEGVGGMGQRTAHSCHCPNGVGAGPQVSYATQELKRVAFLQRHSKNGCSTVRHGDTWFTLWVTGTLAALPEHLLVDLPGIITHPLRGV